MCAPLEVVLWPEHGALIPSNAIVLAEGPVELLDRLVRGYPILLGRNGRSVELDVSQRLQGAEQTAQLVFKPVRQLELGEVYEWRIWPWVAQRDAHRWRAGGPDRVRPNWVGAPRHRGGQRTRGCPGSTYAYVDVPAFDGANYAPLALVELSSSATCSVPQRFIVRPQSGSVAIGFDNCVHRFSLRPGDTYSVAVTAVDGAGNQAPASSSIFVNTPDESSVLLFDVSAWLEVLLVQ